MRRRTKSGGYGRACCRRCSAWCFVPRRCRRKNPPESFSKKTCWMQWSVFPQIYFNPPQSRLQYSCSTVDVRLDGRWQNELMCCWSTSREFQPAKAQNLLLEEHISKIVETYGARNSIEKYAHVVPLSEIKDNDYNLKRVEIRAIFDKEGKVPDEILHNDDFFEDFKLKLSEKLPNHTNKFHGLNFSTLGDYKTQFDLRPIRNIIVKQNSPAGDDSSMYEVFNRLNTGGINLRPQEIRTSMYHSKFYDMLYRIKYWQSLANDFELAGAGSSYEGYRNSSPRICDAH